MIKIKRVYELPTSEDGPRYLVDRLWPRGKKRVDLVIEDWVKNAAPSTELCKWFDHAPERWETFRERYFQELDGNTSGWERLLEAARQEDITLVYAARDVEHNNAVALRQYLERRL